MAKKKSKRFIIPATFFINAIVEEKLDISATNQVQPNSTASTAHEPKSNYTPNKETQPNLQQQKSSPPIAPNTVNLNQGARRKSALSLSSLKRNKLEEVRLKSIQKADINTDNLPKDPFTEATFLKVWKTYIEELHDNGEKIFASILKADIPRIKNNLICVTYPNEMMKAELIKVKPKALKYLRQTLNNFSLEFKIEVNEENIKKFAYTPQEKFDFLKEKNDAIVNLKKTFNLEL